LVWSAFFVLGTAIVHPSAARDSPYVRFVLALVLLLLDDPLPLPDDPPLLDEPLLPDDPPPLLLSDEALLPPSPPVPASPLVEPLPSVPEPPSLAPASALEPPSGEPDCVLLVVADEAPLVPELPLEALLLPPPAVLLVPVLVLVDVELLEQAAARPSVTNIEARRRGLCMSRGYPRPNRREAKRSPRESPSAGVTRCGGRGARGRS
jgi:hypothetical protein